MKPTTEELNASFIEIGLLALNSDIAKFGRHIGYMLSSDSTILSDKEKCEELNEEFYESLLISFNRIKKFKGYQLNENWYNYKNIAVSNVCCKNFLNSLFSLNIRASYHILQLNVIKLNLSSKKAELNKNNITVRKIEIFNYFQCLFFQKDFLASYKGYEVEFGEALGENMLGKWNSILKKFSSKNEEDIKRMKPFGPTPFARYIM